MNLTQGIKIFNPLPFQFCSKLNLPQKQKRYPSRKRNIMRVFIILFLVRETTVQIVN